MKEKKYITRNAWKTMKIENIIIIYQKSAKKNQKKVAHDEA